MGLKTYALKALNSYYWWLDKLNKPAFIRQYPKFLRKLGVKINEKPGDCWISPTVFLDSSGYDMIEIGDDCTISFDVVVLVHDYSINNAFRAVGIDAAERHRVIRRPVKIGVTAYRCAVNHHAWGRLGDNMLVGSGAVVRGSIPAGSIVSGNPATVISDVHGFAKKHSERQDFDLDER